MSNEKYCSMGVGEGGGNLFVHGDYESIKAAQAIVLENDRLRAEVASLKEERDNLKLQYTNARHSQWSSEVNAIDEIHSLTQKLAAANGRVERMRDALIWARDRGENWGDGVRAALSDLPEADKNED